MAEQRNIQQRLSNEDQRNLDRNVLINAHRKYYESRIYDPNEPEQSGFISSTIWTSGDRSQYRAQTLNAPTQRGSVQSSTVSSSGAKQDTPMSSSNNNTSSP